MLPGFSERGKANGTSSYKPQPRIYPPCCANSGRNDVLGRNLQRSKSDVRRLQADGQAQHLVGIVMLYQSGCAALNLMRRIRFVTGGRGRRVPDLSRCLAGGEHRQRNNHKIWKDPCGNRRTARTARSHTFLLVIFFSVVWRSVHYALELSSTVLCTKHNFRFKRISPGKLLRGRLLKFLGFQFLLLGKRSELCLLSGKLAHRGRMSSE